MYEDAWHRDDSYNAAFMEGWDKCTGKGANLKILRGKSRKPEKSLKERGQVLCTVEPQ
jgi:hypothetical protein